MELIPQVSDPAWQGSQLSDEGTISRSEASKPSGADTVFIQAPPALAVYSAATAEEASLANGSISLAIFGGTPPYTILFEGDTASTFIDGLAAGTYTCKVIDSNGCTENIEVVVENTLHIRVKKADTFLVYPNPVLTELYIESATPIVEINVFNGLGQHVLSDSQNMTHISVSHLSEGFYTLRVSFESGQIMHAKVLKL